jgi:leucine dehydrogenase
MMIDIMKDQHLSQLHVLQHEASGLRAIIALHQLPVGDVHSDRSSFFLPSSWPALGGCRFAHYANFDEAVQDAARLAKGMAFKSVMAELPLSGGKAVIIKPGNAELGDGMTRAVRQHWFEAFGRFVDGLGGQYITAMDVGTCEQDMDAIASQTAFVSSTSKQGDPSPWTAYGVYLGMEAALRQRLQKNRFDHIRVAIQGLGHVGWHLAWRLHEAGAQLTVADVDPGRCLKAQQAFGAEIVDVALIHQQDCDIFSPCAMGGGIREGLIEELQCSIVAGCANNQLASLVSGDQLAARQILYVPDYILNAGGLIYAALNYWGRSSDEVEAKIQAIPNTLQTVFTKAGAAQQSTARMADTLAMERISAAGDLSSLLNDSSITDSSVLDSSVLDSSILDSPVPEAPIPANNRKVKHA